MMPDLAHVKRILIRTTNWIGDAVMTTPVVHAIRRNFPEAHIGILAKPWVAPVFNANPHVDEVLIYDTKGLHRGFSGKQRQAKELRQGHWDAGIVLPNSFESALLFAMARIPIRIGYKTQLRHYLLTHPVFLDQQLKDHSHETDHYLRLLKLSGLQVDSPLLELAVSQTDQARGRDLLQENGIEDTETVIGINPGAAFGTAKRWPAERFAQLADLLAEKQTARILIFGGPGEQDVAQLISTSMTLTPLILSGKTTLGEAMALVEKCDLLVTNDSGLMHIAAALHRPLVAIFGPTNPVTTGPLDSRAKIVREPVECSPCLKRECPLEYHVCMDRISVERVFEVCQSQLTETI